MKSDLEKAPFVLDQVIEKSEIDDRVESRKDPTISKDGDGWITHHLKTVRELLENHKNAQN